MDQFLCTHLRYEILPYYFLCRQAKYVYVDETPQQYSCSRRAKYVQFMYYNFFYSSNRTIISGSLTNHIIAALIRLVRTNNYDYFVLMAFGQNSMSCRSFL